jgi:hypothetical protein
MVTSINICFNLFAFDFIRFIGVPTISQRLTHPGEHQSKEEVPSNHLLNQTLKDLLIKFYDPFNQLLQQFIEGT